MKGDKFKTPKLQIKQTALHYMTTLVDVAREIFLILDPNLRVISANPAFYQVFHVLPKQTEGKFLYKLGNGQWNIPMLKNLLEEILPNKKVVKDYEVKHNFQTIGKKMMLLNARKLETQVIERTKTLADRVKELESLNKTMIDRELKMIELKEEIECLKKQNKNNQK